jgi:hypothetical protein
MEAAPQSPPFEAYTLPPLRPPAGQGLRALWLEFRSLVSRIARLRKNNWYRYGICLQIREIRASYPDHVADKYQQARIRGIRRLLAIHPSATLVDFDVLVRTIHPCLFEEDQRKEAESPSVDGSHDKPEQEQHTRTFPDNQPLDESP